MGAAAVPLIMGVGSMAAGYAQQSAQASSASSANRDRNKSISEAAELTYGANTAQQEMVFENQMSNAGKASNTILGAIVSDNAARGVSGSKTARDIEARKLQADLGVVEDIKLSDALARRRIGIDRMNSLYGMQGMYNPSQGLMLLGAGIQGLQTGISAYGAGIGE